MIASLIPHKTKLILPAVALVCLFLACAQLARAQTGSVQLPEPTGNAVNDFAGIIDSDTRQRLETTLINLKNKQQIEFGVVTIKTTGGQDIFDYALALGRKWGIGPQEGSREGLLLLVAVDDRKYFTLVSRHLQGELTDGVVGSIQRQYLVPAFRAGDYGKGVSDTIRAYIDRLAAERGFSTEGIYAIEDTPTRRTQPQLTRRTNRGSPGFSTCCALIFILIIIVILFSSNRGGGGGGCLNLLLLGSLLNTGRGGGWSSGGWSGGGFGGSSGDGGGGFGGFGGGGDFDGGGAGGSW